MYKSQRGCLPYFTTLIGTISFVLICTGILIINLKSLSSSHLSVEPTDMLINILSNFAISLILLIIFLPWSLFLSEMFPAIQLSKEGIKYRYLAFFGGVIKYNEVKEIVDLRRFARYKLIVISRKGFFLFNGLWKPTIFGLLFTGRLIPVLVLSPGIEDREKLLDEIQRNLS
jgi:hypothetical protein